ncbi:hypothetical protein D3C78_1509570 [compost metagenome]
MVEEQREIGRVAGGQVVVAGGHHVGVAIFRHPQRGIGRRLTIFLHHDGQCLVVAHVDETAALHHFGGPGLLGGGDHGCRGGRGLESQLQWMTGL